MKVVNLISGMESRINEESQVKPKPMIEIDGKSILCIVKLYSYYGFNEFVICCGYKDQIVKEFLIHILCCFYCNNDIENGRVEAFQFGR